MKTFTSLITIVFAALIATPSFAQTSGTSPAIGTAPVGAATAPTGQPNPQEMMKQMMEMSKLNENHKLLADMNGSWNYTIKMWMNPDPNAKPQESKGTATRKSAMGGRYFTMDVTGKLQMPGEDGKMKDMQFKGMALEGYDNVKKKFVSSWIDNMGTGIQYLRGHVRSRNQDVHFHQRNGNDARNENASSRIAKDDRQRSHNDGVVRNPWRPGKENHGNRVHAGWQEIAPVNYW